MVVQVPEVYRTSRLELRLLRPSDFSAWRTAHLGRKAQVYKYDLLGGKSFSRAEFSAKLRRHKKMRKTGFAYCYGVFTRKTGEFVGSVDIAVIMRDQIQWGNLGYALLNQHYGKGYGSEAALAALKIGFKHVKLHRIEAAIDVDNRPSIRLARALGMKKEGVRRAFYFENGSWNDHVVFAALPETVGLRSRRPS